MKVQRGGRVLPDYVRQRRKPRVQQLDRCGSIRQRNRYGEQPDCEAARHNN
jgi:hypothetical protein